MNNEVMTRHSEWMSYVVSHLNHMVEDFEHTAKNYRPMLGGEQFLTIAVPRLNARVCS